MTSTDAPLSADTREQVTTLAEDIVIASERLLEAEETVSMTKQQVRDLLDVIERQVSKIKRELT